MTRRIARAKALLRRGDMTVTQVCFAVGCSSLGSFSTRFTELVGESPRAYQRRSHGWSTAVPPCFAAIYTRPIRHGEAIPADRPKSCGMNISVSTCFLPAHDHDAALAFYRDVLGLDVRGDVEAEGMRWVTLGPPSQPEVNIVLEPPAANPNASPADKRASAELMAKGILSRLVIATSHCDAVFEHVQAAGAEVLQEPLSGARPQVDGMASAAPAWVARERARTSGDGAC